MKYLKILFTCLMMLPLLSYGQQTFEYEQPKVVSDGWETENLEKLYNNTSSLFEVLRQLEHNDHKINSFLLIKDHKLLLEEYYNDRTIGTPQDLRSVTKSIISILMGIAVDKGFVTSIDDPIQKYLPNIQPTKNLSPSKEQITIRHLLTMSTGLDCNDWDKKSKGQEDKVYKKKDWIQYTLDLPMIEKPGVTSTYCTMGVVIAAQIISNASNMPLYQFAKQFLFTPLGINNVVWKHTSKKEVIDVAKRIQMTPRDMAKIGLLLLHNGKWNNSQIVSKDWIKESLTAHTKISNIDYGFLWWTIPFGSKTAKVATGNGGQYIMIFKDLHLIAIFTGNAYNSQEDKLPFTIMNKAVLPMFLEK